MKKNIKSMKFINQAILDCSCRLLNCLLPSLLSACIFIIAAIENPFNPKINLSLFRAEGKVWTITYKALRVINPSGPPFSIFTFSFLFIPFQWIKHHQSHSKFMDFSLNITSSCKHHNQLWMCTHAHTYTYPITTWLASFLPSGILL